MSRKSLSRLWNKRWFHTQRLQTVPHWEAHPVSGSRCFNHVSPILKTLHWIPYPHRVTYKMCLLVFHSLRGLVPEHLSNICHHDSTVHGRTSQRSSAHGQLLVQRINITHYGNLSLSVSGHTEWNKPPTQ